MEPNPVWVGHAYADSVDVLAAHADDLVYKVWCGDWCKDCRAQLPDFAAALEAAEIPEERVEHYPVDEDKLGPGVDEYGIQYIPTVVVERVPPEGSSGTGAEIARYVENEPVPIAVYLADEIEAAIGMEPEESTAEN